VRHLKTADGAEVVERLQTFDNQSRNYSYSIIQGPFPVTGYLAKVEVHAAPGNKASVTWSGTFTPVGINDAEASAIFDGIYRGGVEALKANFPD
jgi:hypothetical protein